MQFTVSRTLDGLSPQRIRGVCTSQDKDDVWSLGILLREIIAGQPLYGEHHMLKRLFLIVSTDVPAVSGEWSHALLDFLSKCLTRYHEQRSTLDALVAHSFLERACEREELIPYIVHAAAPLGEKTSSFVPV